MEHGDLVELIQQQILESQALLEAQMRRGERTSDTVNLLRSLRITLRLLSSGIDPEGEAATSFVRSISEEGQALLRRDGHVVGISAAFLQFLRHTGVGLVAGEVLLVEPELARRTIEDSLGELAQEELQIQRKRENLTAALLLWSQDSREPLLQALGEVDERAADLAIERIALSELNLAAGRVLSERVSNNKTAPSADPATSAGQEAKQRRCE